MHRARRVIQFAFLVLGLCIVLLAASTASGTVAFVQEAQNLPTGCGAGASCNPGAFGVNVTAGNLIIACSYFATTVTVTSVSDTLANTYVLGTQTASAGFRSQCATAKNIAGGANTVTFNYSASSAFSAAAAVEYSGADTANPVDVSAQTGGTGTAMSSGNMTTNFSNELIFGFGVPDGAGSQVTAGGSGFTVRQPALPNGGGIVEDKNVTSAGVNNSTATCNASCTGWTMHVIGIKDATQPAGGGPPKLPIVGVGALLTPDASWLRIPSCSDGSCTVIMRFCKPDSGAPDSGKPESGKLAQCIDFDSKLSVQSVPLGTRICKPAGTAGGHAAACIDLATGANALTLQPIVRARVTGVVNIFPVAPLSISLSLGQ